MAVFGHSRRRRADGGAAAFGTPFILGGIRREPTGEAARGGDRNGLGPSALLDSSRRDSTRRRGGELDDRRRGPERAAPARLDEADAAAGHPDRRRRLSGQERKADGQQPGREVPGWTQADRRFFAARR